MIILARILLFVVIVIALNTVTFFFWGEERLLEKIVENQEFALLELPSEIHLLVSSEEGEWSVCNTGQSDVQGDIDLNKICKAENLSLLAEQLSNKFSAVRVLCGSNKLKELTPPFSVYEIRLDVRFFAGIAYENLHKIDVVSSYHEGHISGYIWFFYDWIKIRKALESQT